MRERKGEYFLKIVNEERYQQLFDHPEELRKIITYAKRLMQYEKCFDYSFRDNCMKMELLQVAVQRILQEYGIEVGEVYDLSIEWIESDDEDDFISENEEVLFCVETPYPGIIGFTDVVSAYEDDTETLELFPEEVKAELKEYLGECGTTVLTLDVVEQVIRWYEECRDWRLCEIAFEAYELFCQSLSVSYSSGTDFIQIGEHYYWLYNPEEKLLLDPMEGMKLAVELFDHGNNSLKLYGMLLRNYRVAKKALLLSDMKENEILKLLGLTEKQMRGIRAYRKLPEERLDTVMSILIEAMNRTKISFGNERNLFIQTMAKLIIL